MDWFQKWPRDALVAVSNHFIANFKMVASPETKQQLVETMGLIHDLVAGTCVDYFQRLVLTVHVFLKGLSTVYMYRYIVF